MNTKPANTTQPILEASLRFTRLPRNLSSNGIRLRALVKKWHRNLVTRRQLAELPDHLLLDIGISKAERSTELNKAFWKN